MRNILRSTGLCVVIAFVLPGCGDGSEQGLSLELSFERLPELGSGFVYEGWLISANDEVASSTGRFSVDSSGAPSTRNFLIGANDFSEAAAFLLSIEAEATQGIEPSATRILAGDIDQEGAVAAEGGAEDDESPMEQLVMLTIDHPMALASDFRVSTGQYILDTPCPACTSITDSSNGIAPHVRARTNFVVVSKAPAKKLGDFARKRGWKNLRLLSSLNNAFNAHYYAQFEGKWGEHHPMINVFIRRGQDIHHSWASELLLVTQQGHPRHADLVWPLWNWLDMTPEGRDGFMPQLEY